MTTTFQKSTAREYFESIVVAVILALFVRTFVFQAFKIPTGSMKPNLLVGDHLLVNKFIFAPTATGFEKAILPIRDIRRGDILVFKFPEEPDRDFIKRIKLWVSGSPKRQLNSRTLGVPSGATMMPAYRNPVYGVPSAASPTTVGAMTSRMMRSCI